MTERSKRVYADATTLIGLARINRLELLTLLPTPIFITEHVWNEVADDSAKPGVLTLNRACEDGLLAVVNEGDPDAFPELDPGESTVVSAAADARAMALLDERKARALVARDPRVAGSIQNVTGILGLILLAKRLGRIQTVQPLLDDLIVQNFWISSALYHEVLKEAGEL